MRLDTRGNIFPEAKDLVFEIAAIPEQGMWPSGGAYWKFTFKTVLKDEEKVYSENFGSAFLTPLISALGFPQFKDEPGVFDFEPTMALGRSILASIRHEVPKKGKNAGKTFARMYDIKKSDEIPF